MKLNKIANSIRQEDKGNNLIFPARSKNFPAGSKNSALRASKIEEIKKAMGYMKDMDGSQKKRERWAKIRDLSGNDPAKIATLKEQLYTDDEKESDSPNRYPDHKGYSALYRQYSKDEKYKDFFSKLRIEGDDIILDHKKFALLKAEHNGTDIVSGNFRKKGERGLERLTYMTGKAAIEQTKNQKKRLFKTKEEASIFINQFPGENIKDKISSFVRLFNLWWQNSGFLSNDSGMWIGVGALGYVGLSEVDTKDRSYVVAWRNDTGIMHLSDLHVTFLNDGGIMHGTGQTYLYPFIAFEDC